jgi:hypothetical protein
LIFRTFRHAHYLDMVGVTGSIPVAPTIESSINLLFPGLFGAVRIVSAVCQ